MAAKKSTKLKLSDSTIAQLVKLLQLGLLTGTDVADQFRTLVLVEKDSLLEPDPEYLEFFDKNIQKLQDEADSLAANKDKSNFKFTN